MGDTEHVVRRLLDVAGTTYANEAGIRLRDEPMPLFQLLVLTMLASKPIGADVAATAARELFAAGVRTPQHALDVDRRTVIDAFGRAGYARYDESSADRLTDMAVRVHDEYGGDLRNLATESRHDSAATATALKHFTGIGDVGASIFLREVQDVWTWVRPCFDHYATAAAGTLGLPTDADALFQLAPRSSARLAAALVRVSLDSSLHDRITGSHDKKE